MGSRRRLATLGSTFQTILRFRKGTPRRSISLLTMGGSPPQLPAIRAHRLAGNSAEFSNSIVLPFGGFKTAGRDQPGTPEDLLGSMRSAEGRVLATTSPLKPFQTAGQCHV